VIAKGGDIGFGAEADGTLYVRLPYTVERLTVSVYGAGGALQSRETLGGALNAGRHTLKARATQGVVIVEAEATVNGKTIKETSKIAIK